MIFNYLDNLLPEEITDLIYRELHRACMREISNTLRYKTVFVLVDGRLSFLVCEGQKYENYYSVLEYEGIS